MDRDASIRTGRGDIVSAVERCAEHGDVHDRRRLDPGRRARHMDPTAALRRGARHHVPAHRQRWPHPHRARPAPRHRADRRDPECRPPRSGTRARPGSLGGHERHHGDRGKRQEVRVERRRPENTSRTVRAAVLTRDAPGMGEHIRRTMRPSLLALLLLGSWSTAAPIPERIQEEHGALLDGKIYIAGGFDSTDVQTSRAYRYDPKRNTWERIADLPAPRHHMPLIVVNHTLYAVGGLEGDTRFDAVATMWVYEPDANKWVAKASLPAPRGASAAGVVDGKIVVVGGFGPAPTHVLIDSIAVYDPAKDRWTNHAPIPTVRDHLTAEVVGGILYAIGGRPLDPASNYDVVEAYDLAKDRWTKKAPMPSKRGGLGSAVVNGKIHTFGGETRTSVFNNHEVYDPAHDSWSVAEPMSIGRHGLAVVADGDRIYVMGGGPKAGSGQTDLVEVWR